ncbi:hypothetical protein IscW_ISCW019113, partial [Ixodes scapularis]
HYFWKNRSASSDANAPTSERAAFFRPASPTFFFFFFFFSRFKWTAVVKYHKNISHYRKGANNNGVPRKQTPSWAHSDVRCLSRAKNGICPSSSCATTTLAVGPLESRSATVLLFYLLNISLLSPFAEK